MSCATADIRRQLFRTQFPPSVVRVLGIELWSSVLAASPFTHGVEPSLGSLFQSMFMGGGGCLAGTNDEAWSSWIAQAGPELAMQPKLAWNFLPQPSK